jgi:RecA/RadA recombinase
VENNLKLPIPRIIIPTGIVEFDMAIGGGIQAGRFIEIFGNAGVGKSLFALYLIKVLQNNRSTEVLYVDADQSFDPIHASKLGINLKTLALARIQSGDLSGILDCANEYDVIVVDPIVGMDEPEMIVDFFVKHLEALSHSRASFVLLNQLRVNLGKGNLIAPLGRAFHQFISIRVLITKKRVLSSKGIICGYELNCDVVKNKLAPTTGTFKVTVPYEGGIK